jgi:hypothetical protein
MRESVALFLHMCLWYVPNEAQGQVYLCHAGGVFEPFRFGAVIEYQFSCRDGFQRLCIWIVWVGPCVVLVMFISELVNKPHAELAEDRYINYIIIIIITVITSMSASLLVCLEADG